MVSSSWVKDLKGAGVLRLFEDRSLSLKLFDWFSFGVSSAFDGLALGPVLLLCVEFYEWTCRDVLWAVLCDVAVMDVLVDDAPRAQTTVLRQRHLWNLSATQGSRITHEQSDGV